MCVIFALTCHSVCLTYIQDLHYFSDILREEGGGGAAKIKRAYDDTRTITTFNVYVSRDSTYEDSWQWLFVIVVVIFKIFTIPLY